MESVWTAEYFFLWKTNLQFKLYNVMYVLQCCAALLDFWNKLLLICCATENKLSPWLSVLDCLLGFVVWSCTYLLSKIKVWQGDLDFLIFDCLYSASFFSPFCCLHMRFPLPAAHFFSFVYGREAVKSFLFISLDYWKYKNIECSPKYWWSLIIEPNFLIDYQAL